MAAIPVIEITTMVAEMEHLERRFIDENAVNDLLQRWGELRGGAIH